MHKPHHPRGRSLAHPSGRDWLALAVAVLALWAFVAVVLGSPAVAQEYMRFDGTVQWLSGLTLILALDAQIAAPSYVIVGQVLVPAQSPRQTVNVDLRQLPQSEYAFMRSGERIAVIGVPSDDGRRLIATSIVRNPGPQGSYPQAP
jgi:hypothetical protein